MWRLGVLIYYMIVGSEPDLTSIVSNPMIKKFPYYHSLIMLLVNVDPAKRLTPAKLMDHPVFWANLPSRILRFINHSMKLNNQPSLDQICANRTDELFGRKNWKTSVPADIYEIIPKFDSYEGSSITDLLRMIIVTLTEVQRQDESNKHLRERALCALISSDTYFPRVGRHPIAYFQDMYPNMVLQLWSMIFTYFRGVETKSAQFEQILGF